MTNPRQFEYSSSDGTVRTVTPHELHRLARTNVIQRNTPVRLAGGTKWHVAGSVKGLTFSDTSKMAAKALPADTRLEFFDDEGGTQRTTVAILCKLVDAGALSRSGLVRIVETDKWVPAASLLPEEVAVPIPKVSPSAPPPLPDTATKASDEEINQFWSSVEPAGENRDASHATSGESAAGSVTGYLEDEDWTAAPATTQYQPAPTQYQERRVGVVFVVAFAGFIISAMALLTNYNENATRRAGTSKTTQVSKQEEEARAKARRFKQALWDAKQTREQYEREIRAIDDWERIVLSATPGITPDQIKRVKSEALQRRVDVGKKLDWDAIMNAQDEALRVLGEISRETGIPLAELMGEDL